MKSVELLTISEVAARHFEGLLAQEPVPGTQIRISVLQPGTPKADINVTFCPPGEQLVSDLIQYLPNFRVYIEQTAEPFLTGASFDFVSNELGGGELTIKAPNLKTPAGKPEIENISDLGLTEQIEYVIEEINSGLAAHGGKATLKAFIEEEGVVILQFGGGCQGCGMVSVTLQQGIEKTLKARLPFVQVVRDATDHSQGENPYYS